MINKIKIIASLISILFVAQVLAGCVSDSAQANNAVKNYVDALSKTYLTGDYMDIRKVATLEEQQKIGQKMAEMRSEGKVLRSSIDGLTFEKTEITESRAAITTSERWFYEVLDDKTGKADSPMAKTQYQVLYSVVKKKDKSGSHWLVENATVQKETKI